MSVKSLRINHSNWADAYPRDGHFNQDRMLALIHEVIDGGSKGSDAPDWLRTWKWARLKIGPASTIWWSTRRD